MKKPVLLVLLALTSTATGLSQNQTGSKVVELRSESCEIDEANFNIVRTDALERINDGSSLIAIARLGKEDKSRDLNRKRLNAAKEWLSRAKFPLSKLVLAEGERVSGNGRVEFYVGGALTHVILPKPNMGLCVECCNPKPGDFTSHRKRRKRTRR